MVARIASLAGLLALACAGSSPVVAGAPATAKLVTFPSEDGLEITADLYMEHEPTAPFIVLFHQAGWSRGEYREIAPRLNALGFNCMAVDQRSGKAVNGVTNQTAERAGKATYLDALQDLRAALRYARAHYARGKVIAWGSSYSSALVLVVSADDPELVDATLSFSPGEYFAGLGTPKTWIRDAAARIAKPVFITSAKGEASGWKEIFAAIPQGVSKRSYIPPTGGQHGSRALWKKFSDSPGYWKAVEAFLASIR